jgi:hypothetical protein
VVGDVKHLGRIVVLDDRRRPNNVASAYAKRLKKARAAGLPHVVMEVSGANSVRLALTACQLHAAFGPLRVIDPAAISRGVEQITKPGAGKVDVPAGELLVVFGPTFCPAPPIDGFPTHMDGGGACVIDDEYGMVHFYGDRAVEFVQS